MDEQHIYHHSDSDGTRINVKAVRNSRGFNYEATVTGAKTVEEAMAILVDATKRLEASFSVEKGD
jgi:hypothetical protein